MKIKRYALVSRRGITEQQVSPYLPKNYQVLGNTSLGVVIVGMDNSGWSMDKYVIPRLGSGLMFAKEIDLSHPALKEIPIEE